MSARPANPLAPYIALAGVWLLTVTIVPPRGDFPLNDDWIYAKVVQHLIDTGKFQTNPYGDPTFIAQAYWGAFFVKLFGFNFDSLRLSTLVLALVAAWATTWCAREAGLSRPWAFVCGIVLLTNPVFINLSYTFMTDIPCLALTTLAGGAYLRALRTDRARWVMLGSVLVGVGFLVRQFALVVPVAFAFLLPMDWRARPKHATAHLAAFAAPIVFTLGLREVLPVTALGLGDGWDWSRLGPSWTARLIEVCRHFAFAYIYLVLFMLPLAATAVWGAIRSRPAGQLAKPTVRFAAISVIVMALFMAWLVTRAWPYRLPNFGNVLYDLGVGPLLLPGMIEGNAIDAPVKLGPFAWKWITGIAIALGAPLAVLHASTLARLLIGLRSRRNPAVISDRFLALWAFGMVLVLILPPVLAQFDRYFVLAQAPISVLAARWLASRTTRPKVIGYVAAALCWVFGLVCQQDYLAWNDARWAAIHTLQIETNAKIEDINAGYEPNGWLLSDRFVEESRATGRKIFGPLGWWTVGETYRVSLRPNRGYEVIGAVPYFSWLGFQRRELLLLRRLPLEK